MQKIVAAILILAFLGQSFNQYWYFLDYLVEKKEYIARCENKARPQMHCNGKCQLMKKIRAQQDKEQGRPPELKLAGKSEIIPPVNESLLPPVGEHLDRHPLPTCTMALPKGQPSLLFRPPVI